MIEVHHEVDRIRRRVNVWVISRRAGGPERVMQMAASRIAEWIEQPAAEELVAPTLVLEEEVWAALASAASDSLPPSAATDRHLQDSIAVRDRLLTLVEAERAPGPLSPNRTVRL